MDNFPIPQLDGNTDNDIEFELKVNAHEKYSHEDIGGGDMKCRL